MTETIRDPNRGREIEVNIQFDREKIDMEKLFQVETLLGELGVSFDTGASIGDPDGDVRDWQWDWSLSGPVKVTFVRFVEEVPTEDNEEQRKIVEDASLDPFGPRPD